MWSFFVGSLFCSVSRANIIFTGGRHMTVNLREIHLFYCKELCFAFPYFNKNKTNNNKKTPQPNKNKKKPTTTTPPPKKPITKLSNNEANCMAY